MIENRLNADEYLNSLVPKLIEVFVSFYGESERDRITERFNSAIFIGHINYNNYQSLLREAKKEVHFEAVTKFFEFLDIDYNEAIAKALFGDKKDYSIVDNLKDYYDNRDNHSTYNKEKRLKLAKALIGIPNISMEIDSAEYNEMLRVLDSYKPAYTKMLEYEERLYQERYGQYDAYFRELTELKEKIKEKYNGLYLDYIMPFLSENDRDNLKSEKPSYTYTLEDCELLIGYRINIDNTPLISAFTSESENMLSDPLTNKWRVDSIKSDRVRYYNKKGINLGDEYELYLHDERCQKITPSHEFADQVIKKLESLRKAFVEELTLSMPHIAREKQRIESANLVSSDNEFLTNVICSGTCIVPNCIKQDGGYVLKPVSLINANNDVEAFDCALIHECNHLYELCLTGNDANKIHSVCGWDSVDIDIKGEEEVHHTLERPKRQYEMLNEAINELIAQDICRLMHESGTYFIGDESVCVNSSRSSYSKLFFLVREFYREFKDAILLSRRSGDLTPLFNEVGKENFEMLNELAYEYENTFSGLKIYKVISELHDGIESEDTLYHKNCVTRKDEILAKMREHKLQNSPNLS